MIDREKVVIDLIELAQRYFILCKNRDDYTPEMLAPELIDQILTTPELAIVNRSAKLPESTFCQRCEGNGLLYADGKAHYISDKAPVILC